MARVGNAARHSPLAVRPGSRMAGLQFWKPGTVGPGSNLDRATQTEDNIVQSAPSSLSLQAARERLPIYQHSACFFPLCPEVVQTAFPHKSRGFCLLSRSMAC